MTHRSDEISKAKVKLEQAEKFLATTETAYKEGDTWPSGGKKVRMVHVTNAKIAVSRARRTLKRLEEQHDLQV